jgi:hypothetical protein
VGAGLDFKTTDNNLEFGGATVTADSATRTASSGVSTTPEAKPHDPWWITRTANPRSSASLAPCSAPSRTRRLW